MNDEKRGVEEQYTSAVTTANLRVEADRPSDADVIIAAGWNQSRIGGALLRLHTEWDAKQKPRLFTADQFLASLKTGTTKERKVAAQAMAHAENQKLMAGVFDDLHSLPVVRAQVEHQLNEWRVLDPEMKGSSIVRWWLSQRCPLCHGTKFQTVEGTNRHGSKVCRGCLGTGIREIPFGQEGRRVANWMDQCVERARASIRRRMR